MAAPALCPLTSGSPPRSSRLQVIRKPSLRIRQAVRDNNVPLLMRLQHKGDLRNTDKARLTSLAWAALELSVEVFEWLLLEYGHDDFELSRDADNNNIFHFLAAAPAPPGLSPFTNQLFSDPLFPPRPPLPTEQAIELSLRMTEVYYDLFRIVDWSNSSGKTPLHYAAQVDNSPFIDLFCELGADVDLADLQGNTPLHYASAWGHLQSVRVLLERGAQMGLRNLEGFTPADYAYSNSARVSLDNMAREVNEERRARRKEAKRLERQAREREERELVAAQEAWERQQAETREQEERELAEAQEEWERQQAAREREREATSMRIAQVAGSDMSSDCHGRESDTGTRPDYFQAQNQGGLDRSLEEQFRGTGYDVPRSVSAAANAATQARDRRGSSRSERTPVSNGACVRDGSPTPQRRMGMPRLAVAGPTPPQASALGPPQQPPTPTLPQTPIRRTPHPTPPRSPFPVQPGMRRTDSTHSANNNAPLLQNIF
ncbi:ankyrin [Cutaneotrichosporon oleaginosum]|uniref:Ankyrin n=1 Tax=Cutaneotrichosporon oleaginosum TaxID=879819 RepID=A0A0J0XLE9_9TREE|nr:ankyrin [Cutaneotrichosporon oleaginosum]KLT41915.1 ankyrin [Cutaneotrichosporon oleaginosum]TXT12515.1 hypothetical protein COLE_02925 [Cutaneotrichosporon oleaginosum]